MSEIEKFFLKPAGRHILTVGRDLIQDKYAAIIELVKNAYDADATEVKISISISTNKSKITIIIEDNGHGMSRSVVTTKWLVPSTDDKLIRKTSPSGRHMQGRKGVGRYAASILGDDLLLETQSDQGIKINAYVSWPEFEKAEFLSDVPILIESTPCSDPEGTKLTITGNNSYLNAWNEYEIKKLKFELKKLISPEQYFTPTKSNNDVFNIKISLSGFESIGISDSDEIIEPFPIINLFDYRIYGYVNSNGVGELKYEDQTQSEKNNNNISFNLGHSTSCGDLKFDIRVYDRDSVSIDQLIKRGLKDEKGNYVGKLQARDLLTVNNGIGVYRNGFRIRPLGDAEFDWLRLNDSRVQNPSMKIGVNQVIGYVEIQSEEQSGLEEKKRSRWTTR